ncbi:MAG TPA: glycoside hydrolase family 15 protein [Terriglobales bacterium]|nr:glycoside hydrolase family 15 protein [Terriglobales bacterium]
MPRESSIQDYAVIGDCRAAALVSRAGSLDWLCWPRFDSPAIFAALLDRERGGYWRIAPADAHEARRRYVGESNVLETTFTGASGSATLTDLMPVASEQFKNEHLIPDHEVVRRVECTAGAVELDVEFFPRSQYGLKARALRERGKLGLRLEDGRGAYWLRASVPLEVRGKGAIARVRLRAGERAYFSLSYAQESPIVLPELGEPTEKAIARSVRWWEEWAARCQYDGPYRAAVVRSALALKLLTYAPSGAIVAAATTSLPEIVGASANWDYRYCWLRDASLTMRALLGLGHRNEAAGFLDWLLHATRQTHPELRVLYTVFGRESPRERELTHLRGYRESRPVRVGNAARGQLQLDIYGEVIKAAGQFAEEDGCFDGMTQKVLLGLGKYVAKHWRLPDEGIWEPRTGRRHNTFSRLLCWAALDRLITLGESGRLKSVPLERFARERDAIRRELETRAWNEELQSYTATLDGDDLDATLLRIPWYEFEAAGSPRMRATHEAVTRALSAGNGLLYRYRREPAEGAFGICSFWNAEYLATGGGTLEQAHAAFQALLRYANDVGLYGEEIEPETGAALGNFPQSFTHVGLISAALSIAERQKQGARPPLTASEAA